MKLALFGGTFNPIHNGHIKLIDRIDKTFKFDKIIVMPTKTPPHKVCKDLANENDRLKMCKLAFAGYEKIIVSDYEIRNTQKSFTYLTIEYLKQMYENTDIYLIIGSDMFLSFETWKNFKYILKNVTILTAARNKNEYEKMIEYNKILYNYGGNCEIINLHPYIVSSTQIREAIRQNKNYSCYLPYEVVKYINENKLYM